MIKDVLLRRDTILVRRQRLAPGEVLPWHRDPYHRVAVVLSGDALLIEFRDGEQQRIEVTPGQVDWDEPTDRIHRGINIGEQPYEEVTIFFLDRPDAIPQPRQDE